MAAIFAHRGACYDSFVREVLLVGPQARDLAEIRAARLEERYRVRYLGADLDALDDFDPERFLADAARQRADAVVGTKDQSALLAALLAERRGLPGPRPEALLRSQHKPTSRALQQAAVPEATPRFALLDGLPPFPPPFFVKPVVGRLSERAFRIDDLAELARVAPPDRHTRRHGAIAALAGAPAGWAEGYLAEELLTGREVTLEGYVYGGEVTVVGVTDSVKYAGSSSFERFEYPSALGAEREEELAVVAARLLPALGFDQGFFNVEFFVPPEGPAKIVEVNGRIASQFAPLVRSLHGRSTYEALFALACGDAPRWRTGRPDGVAVSYVLRVFEDGFIEDVPEPEEGVEILVRPGLHLSAQGVNDAESYRLAIVYAAGETREEAVAAARDRAQRLTFRTTPVPPRPARAASPAS